MDWGLIIGTISAITLAIIALFGQIKSKKIDYENQEKVRRIETEQAVRVESQNEKNKAIELKTSEIEKSIETLRTVITEQRDMIVRADEKSANAEKQLADEREHRIKCEKDMAVVKYILKSKDIEFEGV